MKFWMFIVNNNIAGIWVLRILKFPLYFLADKSVVIKVVNSMDLQKTSRIY